MLQDEADERKIELAKKVESATFEQIAAQISDDMDLLRKELPTPASQAVETARDMKYVRERQGLLALNFSRKFHKEKPWKLLGFIISIQRNSLQSQLSFYPTNKFSLVLGWLLARKGEAFVRDWMDQHCRIAFIDDSVPTALSDFTKFLAAKQVTGNTYLLSA